uniref:protein RETICULATA-RELATED 3, chloroplastic-like n=1 Tax=Erigeron canadensis TaxID=72917 RepID=UPI001CB9543A|nr:protein RETICULATA-RELATED 3, chloroplastic-like [Erigeron canadensis]
MGSIAQLNYSHVTESNHHLNPARHIPSFRLPNLSDKKLVDLTCSSFGSKPVKVSLLSNRQPVPTPCVGGGGGSVGHGSGGRGGDGGGGDWSGDGKSDESSSFDSFGPIGAFLSGWRSRVAADPQFPFKVLMEEVVGVSANVFGDMASRPNFGLNELDFVFSTLVVGSILNFTLMYLLAPTMASGSATATLPFIFANSPTSHMFEPGAYSLVNRLGTFVFKGTQFAAVGFAAGLVGTALSNGLIKMRKKMDPSFEPPNKAPPTVLNALTWAVHMGLSANLRYQSLNGIEFVLAKTLPPLAFKSSVVGLRTVNNVLGGMTFVLLARLTGSQSASGEGSTVVDEESSDEEKKLLGNEIPSK